MLRLLWTLKNWESSRFTMLSCDSKPKLIINKLYPRKIKLHFNETLTADNLYACIINKRESQRNFNYFYIMLDGAAAVWRNARLFDSDRWIVASCTKLFKRSRANRSWLIPVQERLSWLDAPGLFSQSRTALVTLKEGTWYGIRDRESRGKREYFLHFDLTT